MTFEAGAEKAGLGWSCATVTRFLSGFWTIIAMLILVYTFIF